MKQKDLLFILISVTFVVGLWIVFTVLHQSLTSTLSDETVIDTKPITSTFDTKTLSLLQKRTVVDPQNSVQISPTPTPTPPPVVTSSPLQTTSTHLATGSANASTGGTTK